MRHISQWSHLEFICYPLFYLVSLIQSIIAGIIIFYFTTSDHRLLHFSMIDYIHGGKISPVSVQFSSVQFSSVAHSGPILWDTMNCSMPGFPVHHHLPEFAQTHVHRIGDAIQPSHPLSSPSSPALNLSQHQGLFQ